MEGTVPAGPAQTVQAILVLAAPTCYGTWPLALGVFAFLLRDSPERVHLSGFGLGEASPSMKGSLKPTAATFLAA